MIQLYKQGNENFDMNGDVVLEPTSCTAHFEINSEWTVELIHPINERSDFIQAGAVIKIPSPYGDLLYEIKKSNKADYDVQATAYPYFMKAKGRCPMIWDTRVVNGTPQTALDAFLSNGFEGDSDIMDLKTCYFENMNVIEAINGDTDNSIRNRWGGELAWINNKVLIKKRLGSDNGARAEFGYNLSGIEEDIDFSEVVTRIYPKAYDGYMLPDHEAINSSLINKYPEPYPKIYEYSNIKLRTDENMSESDGDIICDTLDELYAALRESAAKEFENGVDLPKITYTVSMVDLSRLDEYKEFEDLVKVQLGDTVHVKHRKLGIETTQRVVSIDYDCILEKIDSMTLGTDTTGFFDSVGTVTSSFDKVVDTKTNTLIADKIQGIINAANASFKAQKNVAQKQDIRAMLFEDTDPDSDTFGALCLGTQGLQIAKERNETDTDWDWGTAITFESVIADYIITGILSDKSGNFYLNMDSGDLVMKNGTFSGEINGSNINGGNIDIQSVLKVGEKIILSNNLINYGEGSRGEITVGKDESNAKITMNDIDYDVGLSESEVRISGGDDCFIRVNEVIPSSGNKVNEIHLSAGENSLGIDSYGIRVNGNRGLTGTYTVNNSISLQEGLVTGVS
ncbi:phage tail spike protein [uncultured Faecalicoccus sp.]|uniref:phage tail spike protein n=1 Tax=uncultured Faecalicoccus sp. TaxID=1971760 RepID=UPI002616F962|nr:phage tail spike protein [uncultured Faecalicoccus sp.]